MTCTGSSFLQKSNKFFEKQEICHGAATRFGSNEEFAVDLQLFHAGIIAFTAKLCMP